MSRYLCFLSCLALSLSLGQSSYADNTVSVGPDSIWPSSPAVDVVDPTDHANYFADNLSDDVDGTFAQSFQVLGSSLDLRSIYIKYENDPAFTGDIITNLSISTVLDVFAETHTPPSGDVLMETVTFPEFAAGSGGQVAHILLDSSVNLLANPDGTTGYLLHFSFTAPNSPALGWFRTTSGSLPDGDGNVYAFGQFYEDGDWKNNGTRDGTLALSSQVPEPSSFLLASLMSLAMLARRRRGIRRTAKSLIQ